MNPDTRNEGACGPVMEALEPRVLLDGLPASVTPVPVVLNGGGGNDAYHVRLDSGGTQVEIFENAPLSGPPTHCIPCAEMLSLTVNGGGGDDVLTIDSCNGDPAPPGGLVFNGETGDDILNIVGGSHLFDSDLVAGSERLALTLAGGAAVTFDASQHLAGLNIGAGSTATLTAGGEKRLLVNGLAVAGCPGAWTGTLDLNDNAMTLHYGADPSPLADLADMIAGGYAGGAWDGPGVMSTIAQTTGYALGVADGADWVVADLAAGDILVAYCLPGDVNMDESVEGADVDFLLGYYGTPSGASWTTGDSTYDGAVNGDDVDLFLGYYGRIAHNRPRYTTLFAEPWDDIEAGRVVAVAGTLDADTVHVRQWDNTEGAAQSARITASGGTPLIAVDSINLAGGPIDLSTATHFIFDYFMSYEDPADWQTVSQLRLVMSSDATDPNADRSTVYLCAAAGHRLLTPGWHRIILRKSDFVAFRGAGTWSAIRSMRVRLDAPGGNIAAGVALTVDWVAAVVREPTVPRVFLAIDDGHVNNVALAAVLDSYGVPGNFFINPQSAITGVMVSSVYEGAAAASLEQLLAMQSNGHLVGNHSYSHLEMLGGGGEFTTDDPEVYADNVLQARDWMVANGLTAGADLLAAPGGNGALTITAVDLLFEAGIRQVRLTLPQGVVNDVAAGPYAPLGDGSYRQPFEWLDPRLPTVYTLSHAKLEATADAAIANNATLGVLLHGEDGGSTALQAGLAYWRAKADAGLIQIITLDELLG